MGMSVVAASAASAASTMNQIAASIKNLRKMHGALILANVFFGVGTVLGALGLPATHPLVFALVREIGAGGILLCISTCFYRQPFGNEEAVLLHNTKTDPKVGNRRLRATMLLPYAFRGWMAHWKQFALLGLVLFGNQAGFIVGIKMAGPITASVWQPSQPIFTAAICMTLGWETIQRKRVIGVLVACVGCVVMVVLQAAVSSNTSGVHDDPMTLITKLMEDIYDADEDPADKLSDEKTAMSRYVIGNVLFFVNCLCTSLYVILSKRMIALYPPLLVTAWSYIGASLMMFLTILLASAFPGSNTFFCPECSAIENPVDEKLFQLPSGAVPALLYYIVFASVGSYGLITWANQYATGTLVMSYTVLQPVTSVLLTTGLLIMGAVMSCQPQRQSSSEVSTAETAAAACLDYPSLGTIFGMVGVFAGLGLIISTEPNSDKVHNDDHDDPEKYPFTAKSEESSSE